MWRENGEREANRAERAEELRCGCGRLLARVVPGGLELKCGRCKSTTFVPWSGVEGAELLRTPPGERRTDARRAA